MLSDRAAQNRLASLEGRISRLEDIEIIRGLLVIYANAVDTNDWDRLAEIFTPDAHYVIGVPWQVDVNSPEAIIAVLRAMSEANRRMRHKIVNVGIDPLAGTGQAYFMCSMIDVQQNQSMLCEGSYRYRFARIDDRWLIAEQIIDVAYLSPVAWMLENA